MELSRAVSTLGWLVLSFSHPPLSYSHNLPIQTGPELEFCIANSAVKVLFVDEDRAIRLQPHMGPIKAAGMELMVLCHSTRRDIPGTILFEDYIKGPEGKYGPNVELPALPWSVEPDDDATIF